MTVVGRDTSGFPELKKMAFSSDNLSGMSDPESGPEDSTKHLALQWKLNLLRLLGTTRGHYQTSPHGYITDYYVAASLQEASFSTL